MNSKHLRHKHYPEGMPNYIDLPNVSLYDFLEQSTNRYPDNTAIIFQNHELTYLELKERVDRIATALNELGIKKGHCVAIMLPNCPQLVICYYAIMRLGAMAVMVNPMYTERELTYILKDSGVGTLIYLDQMQPKVMNILADTAIEILIATSVQQYLALGNDLNQSVGNGGVKEILSFEQLLVKSPPTPPEVALDIDEDIVVLQYTGGTTGVVKGAMLTHRNLAGNAIQTRHWLRECREGKERFFCVLPFFHIFAMTTCMNLSVYLVSTMILIPRLEAMNLLKQIVMYQPTVFQGVPSLYVAVIANPEVKKYDLSSIRICLSGGAPLPAEVQRKFEVFTGAKLVEGYGLTEASPVTQCNPLNNQKVDGSIGLPIPNTEVKIVDLETGSQELPLGAVGELCIRGPQVMKGYWQMPEETAKVLRDGWLHTGDIARLDEKGFTYIVDRKKDLVISMGYNIYPREVEEIIYGHPKVKEVAVIGIKDRTRGEVLKAFVVLHEGEEARKDEIIKYCRQHLTQYKVPKRVEFRKELPTSTVGKVLRRLLAAEEAAK